MEAFAELAVEIDLELFARGEGSCAGDGIFLWIWVSGCTFLGFESVHCTGGCAAVAAVAGTGAVTVAVVRGGSFGERARLHG